MKSKSIKIYIVLLLIVILSFYVFSYINWRKKTILILTKSEYLGNSKKQDEKPAIFYFSTNDQETFLGKIFIPAIMIDLYISKLDYAEE